MTTAAVVTDHGLTVELPGRHQGVIFTDSHADSEQFAELLRHAGCLVAVFDIPTAARHSQREAT